MNAQCLCHSAPCSIHRRSTAISPGEKGEAPSGGRISTDRIEEEYALRALAGQGKFDAARSTHEALTSTLPGIPSIDIWGGLLAYAQGDHGLARDLFVADLERRRGTPSVRAGRSYQLGQVAAAQGHVEEAKRLVADAVAADDERGIPAAGLFGAVSVARLELDILGAPDQALRRVEEALASNPLSQVDVVDRPYLRLIAVYADAGRADRAQELLTEYEQVTPCSDTETPRKPVSGFRGRSVLGC